MIALITFLVLAIGLSGMIDYFVWTSIGWQYFWIGILTIYPIFVILSFLYIFLLAIISLFCNKKKPVPAPNRFAYHFLRQGDIVINFFARVKIKATGLERIPKDQKVLYVNNHNSNFDQMVMIQLLKDKKLCFITKPGNFGIPIAGSYMYWCGFLPINREDPRLAIPTIRKASNYVKEQITSVSICPEGTRNKTDQLMLPFHPGSFKIATSAKCPIVLISIRNTKNIKKNFPLHSTTVSFDVLTVLFFEQYQGLTTAELSEKCHKIIEDNLKKENAEE